MIISSINKDNEHPLYQQGQVTECLYTSLTFKITEAQNTEKPCNVNY